jgi:outer membrane receptor for ferrienterochelin and colicins
MARGTISLLLVWLLSTLSPKPLAAQSTPAVPDVMGMGLEELLKVEIDSVFGASGYKQNVTNAPASITVVTGEEIRRYGYRTLADVLRNVPGFYVTSDRVGSYVGVRGFGPPGDYNSRILLLVDGHRVADTLDGGVPLGQDFPIDTDLIDRMEVIRGPNSPIYVASALLGVINVIIKQGRDQKGLSVSGEAGSFGTYGSRLTYGHEFDNGVDLLLSGSYVDSHGPDRLYFKEFDNPLTNNGIAQNADGSNAGQEFGRLSYRGFTLEGAYGASEQGDPAAAYGTLFNDPANRIRVMTGYLDLSYQHKFGSDWGYVARIYYDNTGYHGTYPTDETSRGGPSDVLNEDLSRGQDAGASFGISKSLPFGQKIITGSEYRNTFQEHQWNYDAQPYVLYLNNGERSSVWGVHVQDEITLGKGVILDLGINYDHYSTFGGATNPRAALLYQPWEGTNIKLLYSQSYRAPTAFELYYAVLGSQEANLNLRPEKARTTELVLEQSLPRGFRLVASGYYYLIRDLINAETDPLTGLIVYQNDERVDLRGAEIALKRQSRSGLEAGVSLSLQDAKDLDGSGSLINSPHVLGQASFSVPLFKGKLFASMELQYVSRRRTLGVSFAGAYVLPNFTLFSPKALPGWELSASVYNAFNQTIGDPASVAHVEDIIYQDGINFRVKLTYHF